MTRMWLRGCVAGVAAIATLALGVQFLVIEPADSAADRAAQAAAAREAELLAELLRHGGAVGGDARVASASARFPGGGGVGIVGDGRVVWVPASSTAAAASALRVRILLLAGTGLAAVAGWALWAGITRRRGAERVARRQVETIGMVAHDLRGPLTGIALAADRLVRTELPAPRAAAHAAIERECERLQVIADDILSVCCDTVEQVGDRGDERLADVLDDVAARVRGAHGCDVVIAADPTARYLRADRRLARAVANVAENAARHSPAGQPVHLRAVADGDAVELVVEDGGTGFAPSFQVAAFCRGRRGGRAGLGLTSARRMMDLLGGSLGIGTRTGGGAVVSLRVPRRSAPR
jgi:signal transduction histidine kinase